jgi:hypothetical protein
MGRIHSGTLAAVAVLVIALGLPSAIPVAGQEADPALQAPRDGHRVLRDNPADPGPPTAPAPFGGFPDAPAFTVVPRQGELTWYPCQNCHIALPANPEPRRLMAPHPAVLNHGDGRFWCLQCHKPEDRNQLRTLAGEPATFDESWKVCGQCHYQPQQDWAFGAHGKRVENWEGERRIYGCTHCHDPHDPAIKPRAPEPPPPVREGLSPMNHGAQDHAS